MSDRRGQKIAVAGKGGSGKTTVAGTLARLLARRGEQVWAIDADSTPNLGLTLGLPAGAEAQPLPRTLLAEQTDAEGKRSVRLAEPPAEIASRYGSVAPDGVRLLTMARVDHAGAG